MRFIPLLLLPLTLAIAGDTNSSEQVEVEVTTLEGFTVVGMEYVGSSPEDVMALWEGFVQRIGEIPGAEMDDDAYGVIFGYDAINGEFSYMACVESDMTGPVPEGMRELSVPGGDYAVFTFQFDILDEIYGYIYGEWLPQSEYTHGEGYDFEYYPAEFMPSEEGMLMKLFVSVE
jgi:predicted transcriptional regulator YdeE